MIDFLVFILIGLFMGLFGGLLGLGGSVIMIPALVFYRGENQHLYQAAAMICNFFVGGSSVLVHKKAGTLVKRVLKWFLPFAVTGVLAGVAVSNTSVFAGNNSYILAKVFGCFLVYVFGYNIFKFYRRMKCSPSESDALNQEHITAYTSVFSGFMTGFVAGLLGIGAGSVAIPLQQLLMKMPLKKAMSNSAATIVVIAAMGALLKNATLSQHGIDYFDSLKIAGCVGPSAIIGAYLGGKLMHLLPLKIVWMVFLAVLVLAAFRMLTV